MSQYLSWDGAELDTSQWQGILYLEMDTGVDAGTGNDIWIVTVHLARDSAGMSRESIAVEGGRRITLPEPDVAFSGKTVTLTFSERGDHSPYTVRLLHGGDKPVHPFFAEAQFGFYVECETGDCRRREILPMPNPAQPPSIDTRYKDFRGFMRMLSEWVRVTNPDWADLSPASLERTFMELLAHQGDMLSYYQDRIANEAFLSSASQRYSLKQHATLLGYPMFEGEGARTYLAFETTGVNYVPAGFSVENRRLHGERPVVFYVRERTRIDPANNSDELRVAAWPGASSATIPVESKTLLLWEHRPTLLSGMRFAFVQGNFSQVVTLTEVRLINEPGWVSDPSQSLTTDPKQVTEITFDPPLNSELRPWDSEIPLKLYANLADAGHGRQCLLRIESSVPLGSGAAVAGASDAGPPLDRHNSVVVAVPRQNAMVSLLRAMQLPEGPVIHERDDNDRSVPIVEVQVDGELWFRQDSLHESKSYDTHYVASTDNTGRLWLEFGDGVRGREIEIDPGTGQPLVPIAVEYRTAEPLDGNCALDTLTEVVHSDDPGIDALSITAITNIVPGAGGKAKDTLDEIRENVPISLKHGALRRAVAPADYAEIARQEQGVSRAATKELGGPFNSVAVLIDAEDEATLSDELIERVWTRIENARMTGREHFVYPAEYVPLRVGLVVCVETGYLRHEVRDRVLADLRPGTNEQPGFFHPDKLTFGKELEAGDLIAFVQSIPGVHAVKITTFCKLTSPEGTIEDRITFWLTEVARLDADEDFPEYGILDLKVIGLDGIDDEERFDMEPASSGGES